MCRRNYLLYITGLARRTYCVLKVTGEHIDVIDNILQSLYLFGHPWANLIIVQYCSCPEHLPPSGLLVQSTLLFPRGNLTMHQFCNQKILPCVGALCYEVARLFTQSLEVLLVQMLSPFRLRPLLRSITR